MTAEESLYARLSTTPGVTSLVSARIFPMVIPEGVAMPVIVYQLVDAVRPGSLRGPVGIANSRLQTNCWADTYATAKAVAAAVRRALDGWDDGTTTAVIVGERDLSNPDGLRKGVGLDFSFWVPET